MKKDLPSQDYQDNVSRAMHRSTITMTLVILVLGIIILPWSDPSSAAFVPLVLSMAVSLFTLIKASLSLKKQIKKKDSEKQK